MRTAIYVYDTDPESQTEFALSANAVVKRYDGPNNESTVVNDNGRCVLAGGIYKVMSEDPPGVQLSPGKLVDYDVVAVTDDKDPWPDPPSKFHVMFADVSLMTLRAFLPEAKGGFGASSNDKHAR